MTTPETTALAEIGAKAAAGLVMWTGHALQRLAQRRFVQADVIAALVNATECQAQKSRYLVPGQASDGRSMLVVVKLLADVIVVTVMPPR